MPKGDLRMIDGFIAVGACVRCPYLAKSCCYQKYMIIKMYVLRYEQSIYGISFMLLLQ